MDLVTVIFEDAIHRAILEVIIPQNDSINWVPSNGKTKIDERTPNYIQASNYQKVIILRDLDSDAACAPEFLEKRNLTAVPTGLAYRLAVRDAEAWLMADKVNFCDHFRCAYKVLNRINVDEILRPKNYLLSAILRGRLPIDRKSKIVDSHGERMWNYNQEMLEFISNTWDLNVAMENSESLRRTVSAIRLLLT